jgi:NAD(P)-dependent dehydrogenase (short-subunit alcohol dehydrogenase family)
VAVVTGGSRGIGRAVAARLVSGGADVVICGRDAGVAEDTAKAVSASGPGRCVGVAADVRQYDQVEAVMARAADAFGGLDILVNSAGVSGKGSVADLPLDLWRAVIDTNLTGVFYCCRAAIPWMRRRGGGYIINIGSLAGINPIPHMSAYNASKFGLNGFTEALMQEVRHDGIRVSGILPGSVNTEFGGRATGEEWRLAPEDVAAVVAQLLSHDPRSLPSRIEIRPARPPKK